MTSPNKSLDRTSTACRLSPISSSPMRPRQVSLVVRRFQQPSEITMQHNLLTALTIAVLSGCAFGQDDRLVVKKDPSNASRFICDVKYATFKTPKGWRPNRSDKNTYAVLSRSNETYPNLTQMISIDIGKPVAPTAKAVADAFAKKWHGQVEESSLNIDGETGFRVTIPPDNKTVRPIDCVITMKRERVFMLIGAAKQNGELSNALDEIVASWKWKK